MAAANTVHERIEQARYELRPRDVVLGVAILLAIGFVLAVLQTPLAHDSLHNFRHTAGVVCH